MRVREKAKASKGKKVKDIVKLRESKGRTESEAEIESKKMRERK